MSDHEMYKKIKRERKQQKKVIVRKPLPPTSGRTWEEIRSSIFKGKVSREYIACVCSHSKYHHTFNEATPKNEGRPAWGKCMQSKVCGCEEYQEHVWDQKP